MTSFKRHMYERCLMSTHLLVEISLRLGIELIRNLGDNFVLRRRVSGAVNIISDHITDDIPPQMNILNMVIPIVVQFLTFIRQRHSILHQTEASSAT